MALILIGTGIAFDLTISAMEKLKSCDDVYIETYTNPIDSEKIKTLEKTIDKPIIVLDRSHIESSFLVDKARSADVCVLVSGDPLTATTHITLIIEAKQKAIPVHVIHNSSIYSVAPARSGLQIYRFGKTASLVNPRPNYKPTSSLDIIRQNLARDAHTLVLLDTEPQPMDAKTALEMLSEFPEAIVLSRVGHEDEKIRYGKTNELKAKYLGKPPFAIIIPARPHPVEQEFLELLKD